MLGTIGGKLGLGAGIIAALATAEPAIALTPGSCFFEGGCGRYENLGLAAAALICLLVGLVVGLLVRAVVNQLASSHE
jgi:hypothetical protein